MTSTGPSKTQASLAETIYQWALVVLGTATNAFAIPVWAAVVGIGIGLFTDKALFDAIGDSFAAALTWSFTTALGVLLVLAFAIFGLIHALRLKAGRAYEGWPAFAFFLVDHTWGLPNTIVGSLFAVVTLGLEIDEPGSKGTGRLLLEKGLFGNYDTTFGNVTAGKLVPAHELVHVIQARITGPFFYPFYIANYLVHLVPYWLALKALFKIYPGKKIDSVGHYFTHGVYPFTIFEAIAYAVEGSPP
jgi:fumarate reductase subunit D